MWPGGAEAKHKGRDTPKDVPPDPNTETLTSSLDDLVASLREQMAADPNTEALTAQKRSQPRWPQRTKPSSY